MDVSGRYAEQQRIKIIEAYFATKSVILTQRQCRKELGRDKISDRKTIERLVAKFRETGSVANANKSRSGRPCHGHLDNTRPVARIMTSRSVVIA